MIKIGIEREKTVESVILQAMKNMSEPWTRPTLYGGSAGVCQRENFLSAQDKPLGNVRSVTTPQSYFYMSIGDGIEKAVIDGLTRADRLFGDNVYLPVSTPLVRGKMDIIFLDENNEICVGEIKSCGKLPNEPKHGHLAQATTYASISGHDNVYVIYISRNVVNADGSVAIKAFKVDTSKNALMANMRIIVESGKAIESGFIPQIPTHIKKSMCYYCPYNESFCWGENASDGRFERLPESMRDQYVIELNSSLENLFALRQNRWKEHLVMLCDEPRVKGSEVLSEYLNKKLKEVVKKDE